MAAKLGSVKAGALPALSEVLLRAHEGRELWTRELALMSRLRLMGLGLAICPSHTEVALTPARAWQNWLI